MPLNRNGGAKMTTQRIRIVEGTTPPAPAVTGGTVLGLVGTLLGGDSATDFPVNTAQLLTDEERAKLIASHANAYTGGTLLYALRTINARVNNPIVIVRVVGQGTTAVPTDAVASAGLDVLATAATGLGEDNEPDIVLAPELTWARQAQTGLAPATAPAARRAASAIATKLDEVASTLRGVAITAPPNTTGSVASAIRDDIIAWADNNRHSRSAIIAPRVGQNAAGANPFQPTWARFDDFTGANGPPENYDASPNIAAMLAYLDDTRAEGRATNPQRKLVTGIANVVPRFNIRIGGFGNTADDGAALNAAEVNTFIRRAGWHFWGLYLGNPTATDRFRYINTRRMADLVEANILLNAEAAVEFNITDPRFYRFVIDRVQTYIDGLVAGGQVLAGSVARSASDVAGDQHAAFDVSITFHEPVETITFTVTA